MKHERRKPTNPPVFPSSTLHAPQSSERPSFPGALPAIWNIPFARNPFFTAREEQLAQIHEQLQRSQSAAIGQVQAISGLGGIGKTQIAIEYAYRHSQEYQAVLWVHADTLEALNASYSELAERLNLSGKNAIEQEIVVFAVQTWLAAHHDWLLILDNLDEPLVLFPLDEKGQPCKLSPFLPVRPGGHILLTTRSDDLSSMSLALGLARPLRLTTFTPEQGAYLLLARAERWEQATPQDQQLAAQIARELGGLALAIDQAGAYLNATGASLASYLQLFQQRRVELLKKPGNTLYPESVATTWAISFRRVEERNPAAAELLHFCAFLASNDIPEELLTAGADGLGDILTPIARDPLKLDAAVEALRANSLIARDPQTHTFTVHRLVQAVQRDSLTMEAQQRWMQRAIHAVAFTYSRLDLSGLDFTHWPTLERLLPHALVCATWIEQEQIMGLASVHLLEQAGSYLDARVRYREAEPLLVRALTICEQQFGSDHPYTAKVLINLAMHYGNQGKFGEAEELFQRALTIYEQHLEVDQFDVALCLNYLAELYRLRGKLEEVEPLLVRALAIGEEQPGTDYACIVSSLTIQALLYWDQLKYTEAEPLLVRALTICEQQFEADDPYRATVLNNLAMVYLNQREYDKAEELFQHALTICEYQLGADHPYVALCLNNLAGLYDSQRKYTEAEPLYRRALDIRKRQLEADHPDTIQSLNNLAMLYLNQGKYTEGEMLSQEALDWEQQLGAEHLYVGLFLNNLACLYWAQDKYTEAELLLQQSSSEHPDTDQSPNNLAELPLINRGKNAGSSFQHIFIIREQSWGTIPQIQIRALTTWLGCVVSTDGK